MPQSWFKPNGHRFEQRLHFSSICHNRAITMALAAVSNNEDYKATAPRTKNLAFVFPKQLRPRESYGFGTRETTRGDHKGSIARAHIDTPIHLHTSVAIFAQV